MKKLIRVSIGIPAFNEEANIESLLHSILAQNQVSFVISEIIVVLDGSTDKTLEKIIEIKDKGISVFPNTKRIGKSARLNQIFKKFIGDVLILMDADVTLPDNNVIERLLKNRNIKRAGLIGVNATPVKATTFFERVIEAGVNVLKESAKGFRNGDNYLSFKGCFLALDKKLAKEISLPQELVNNDAYIYFKARSLGYAPRYADNVVVFYNSPKTLKDHLNQSSRYRSSYEELRKFFNISLKKEYKIPLAILISSTLKCFIRDPFYLLSYIVVRIITKIKREKRVMTIWNIATTTKK